MRDLVRYLLFMAHLRHAGPFEFASLVPGLVACFICCIATFQLMQFRIGVKMQVQLAEDL